MGERKGPGTNPETIDPALNETWKKIFIGIARYSESQHSGGFNYRLDHHPIFDNPNLREHYVAIDTVETTEDGKPSVLILSRKCNGKRVQREIVEADWTEQRPEIIEERRRVFDGKLALPFEELAVLVDKLIDEMIAFGESSRTNYGWDPEESPDLDSPFQAPPDYSPKIN